MIFLPILIFCYGVYYLVSGWIEVSKDTKIKAKISKWYDLSWEIQDVVSRMDPSYRFTKCEEIMIYINELYKDGSLEKTIRESENVILYKSEIVKKWGNYLNPMDYSKLISEIREYNLNKILK